MAPGGPASTMGRAAALGLLAVLVAGCGGNGESSVQFGETQELGNTRSVEVGFESRGAELSGTLKVPTAEGSHPALVWVHGSGREHRDTTAPFFTDLVDARFAVFTFDKRGVGKSQGRCCPLDFDLLADDVIAAVDALRSRDDIDDDRIGLLGLSQGGWIIPVAATKSGAVSFAVVLSGPAVSVGEEGLFSGLTGDEGCTPSGTPPAVVSRLVREANPSEFDPRPYLARLDIPVLWLYGANDMSQPVEKDLTVLEPLRRRGKEFEIVVFPAADHALQHCGGGSFVPELQSTMHSWLREHVG